MVASLFDEFDSLTAAIRYQSWDKVDDYDKNHGEKANKAFILEQENLGHTVILPKDNQLLLDLDDDLAFYRLPRMVGKLAKITGITASIVSVAPSASGLPHRHVVLELDCDIDARTRILFQTVMGSDPARSLHDFVRERQGVTHPTLLIDGGQWKKR